MDKIHIRTPEEEKLIRRLAILDANNKTFERNRDNAFETSLLGALLLPFGFNTTTPGDFAFRAPSSAIIGGMLSNSIRKYADLRTGIWDKDADNSITNNSNELDSFNKKVLIQKLTEPGISYRAKKNIIENSPYPFTDEEKDLYLNSNITNGDKLMQFNDFIKNHSDFVGIGGRMLIGAGLAGIYYLWKKWRDSGKIETDDIRVAKKIDDNSQ